MRGARIKSPLLFEDVIQSVYIDAAKNLIGACALEHNRYLNIIPNWTTVDRRLRRAA